MKKKKKLKENVKILVRAMTIFAARKKSDQKSILNYLCSGKGVIPYEIINSFDSLNIAQSIWKCDDKTSPLRLQKKTKTKRNSLPSNI